MSEEAERLEGVYSILKEMYLTGQVSADMYHKGLISLASDWAVLGKNATANNLVSEIPATYISDVLPVQMSEDPEFHRRAESLAIAIGDPHQVSDEDAKIDLMLLSRPLAKA